MKRSGMKVTNDVSLSAEEAIRDGASPEHAPGNPGASRVSKKCAKGTQNKGPPLRRLLSPLALSYLIL